MEITVRCKNCGQELEIESSEIVFGQDVSVEVKGASCECWIKQNS